MAAGCQTPHKIRFHDRIAAALAAEEIGRKRDSTDNSQEPYRCGNHWHLRNVVKYRAKKRRFLRRLEERRKRND